MALTRTDPYLSFNFRVEVDGIVEGGFSEVSGLQSELETLDYREGGQNAFVHKLAGPVRYPANLTLRRGIASADLWDWFSDAAAGQIRRANTAVLLCDTAGDVVWRWSFTDTYPVRWTGPDLRAAAGAVAVEALELAHRGLAASESGPEGGSRRATPAAGSALTDVEEASADVGRALGL